jgi:hypothetical protein
MTIKRKRHILVAASLVLEDVESTIDFHNYITIDNKDDKVAAQMSQSDPIVSHRYLEMVQIQGVPLDN